MEPDIHFGDLEHSPLQPQMRPDRNRQWAVAEVYRPHEEDLPVFVDLDAMREMEQHALSDPAVELGGVMLGGQFTDEEGKPFVMVQDVLRARHYESTRGSFKFTHETWEQITRERDLFPKSLRMVGWYHTHPDWGVFLSGLDLFICENFFNQPLDVALVIDPCRQDRGFFQWTANENAKIRRTRGFYLMTSRFRAGELKSYVDELEGELMPQDIRYLTAGGASSVLPVTAPTPPWMFLSVLALFTLQFCLLLILAWRFAGPLEGVAEAPDDLAAVHKSLDRLDEIRAREADLNAKLQVLELVVRSGTQAPEGVLTSLAQQTAQVDELRTSLRGQQSLNRELDAKLTGFERQLADSKKRETIQKSHIESLEQKLATLTRQLDSTSSTAEKEGATQADAASQSSLWSSARANAKPLGFGMLLGGIAIGAIVLAAQHWKKTEDVPSDMDVTSGV